MRPVCTADGWMMCCGAPPAGSAPAPAARRSDPRSPRATTDRSEVARANLEIGDGRVHAPPLRLSIRASRKSRSGRENHPRIQLLSTFDSRYDADHRVVVGVPRTRAASSTNARGDASRSTRYADSLRRSRPADSRIRGHQASCTIASTSAMTSAVRPRPCLHRPPGEKMSDAAARDP